MKDLELKREPDGTRYVRPYLGTNAVTGRPLRPYHRFPDHLTDEECLEEARRWLDGLAPATGKRVGTDLGGLLARYVADLELQGAPINTVRTYRALSRYAARIADRDVRGIKAWEVEELYRSLQERGGAGGGLSNTTVRAFHWFMRGAFNWMTALGIVDFSPIAYAAPPKAAPTEAAAFDAGQIAAVSAAIAEALEDGSAAVRAAAFAAYLGLNMGLRCGEACAVRPCDVWGDRMMLHVGGTVVTAKGMRSVRQDFTKGKRSRNVAVTAEDLAVIERHRASLPALGSKAPLVTRTGAYMDPSNVAHTVRRIMAAAGTEGTFHTLRHTHATWLLAHGADVKTVSERLGHADVDITLRIYSHVMPGRDAAAAELFKQAKGLR